MGMALVLCPLCWQSCSWHKYFYFLRETVGSQSSIHCNVKKINKLEKNDLRKLSCFVSCFYFFFFSPKIPGRREEVVQRVAKGTKRNMGMS